jgi:hypothetical protein
MPRNSIAAPKREMCRGPLEDDPAPVRGFVLTRLNKAHRGYSEEHGHRQHHKPTGRRQRLAIGMASTAGCGGPPGTHIAKYTSTSSTTFIESTRANLRHPFKFGCMGSRGLGENEQLVISATALVHP